MYIIRYYKKKIDRLIKQTINCKTFFFSFYFYLENANMMNLFSFII